MKESQLISWIFLATAFASEKVPANVNAISQLADGINHAIPTHEELQSSLKWLTEQGLVQKEVKGYQLTQSGIQIIEAAKRRTNSIIVNIWDELTNELESMGRIHIYNKKQLRNRHLR